MHVNHTGYEATSTSDIKMKFIGSYPRNVASRKKSWTKPWHFSWIKKNPSWKLDSYLDKLGFHAGRYFYLYIWTYIHKSTLTESTLADVIFSSLQFEYEFAEYKQGKGAMLTEAAGTMWICNLLVNMRSSPSKHKFTTFPWAFLRSQLITIIH